MAGAAGHERAESSGSAAAVDLLVAIPALDEARTVADVVSRVPRSLPGIDSIDVLVVDDGSADATAAQAAAAGARVIRHPRQRGVGPRSGPRWRTPSSAAVRCW